MKRILLVFLVLFVSLPMSSCSDDSHLLIVPEMHSEYPEYSAEEAINTHSYDEEVLDEDSITSEEMDTEAAISWLSEYLDADIHSASSVAMDSLCVVIVRLVQPGSDTLGGPEVYVLTEETDTYAIVAQDSVNSAISVGFSADLLLLKQLTIIFGDLSDGYYEFWNDKRVATEYVEVRAVLSDGTEVTTSAQNNMPYLMVVDGGIEIVDIEYVTSEGVILYSDFFDDVIGDENPYDDDKNPYDEIVY